MVKFRDIAVYIGVVLLGLSLGPALMLVQASAAPADESDTLAVVVFPPWVDAPGALSVAGWHSVGPTQAILGTLAAPSSTASEYIEGAWAILRNPTLIAFCISKEPT